MEKQQYQYSVTPVTKHSGSKRISAWFSAASFIAIMILSIFLSICALMALFCKIAILNTFIPSLLYYSLSKSSTLLRHKLSKPFNKTKAGNLHKYRLSALLFVIPTQLPYPFTANKSVLKYAFSYYCF